MAQFITVGVNNEKKARFRVQDIVAIGMLVDDELTLHMRGGKKAVLTISGTADTAFVSTTDFLAAIEKAFVLEDLPYHEDKGFYLPVENTKTFSALANLA